MLTKCFTFHLLDSKEENKSLSKKVATIAWMVLMGDSLHKFIDGVSIGAAFTQNLFTGVSVSLAILCEELPHELGNQDLYIIKHLHIPIGQKNNVDPNQVLLSVMCDRVINS